MKSEDPYWRKAKIAARILKRAAESRLSARDRRLVALILEDPGVTNRLIDQAVASISAPRQIR